MPPDLAVVADVTDSLARLVRSATLPRFMERVAGRAGVQLDATPLPSNLLLTLINVEYHSAIDLLEQELLQ